MAPRSKAKNSGEKVPFAHMFYYMSADSSKVLGIGVTPKGAYDDAVSRHGEQQGYGVECLLTTFPKVANPAPAIVAALRASYPPTLREGGMEEEKPAKKEPKLSKVAT